MSIEIKMPALSPTMEEGTLAKWLVKEGDTVKSGDLMAEIETDKATMEFEAVDEGVIAKILVPEGTDNVKVGTVIAVLAGEALGVTELKPKSGFYDYDAKYTDGLTEHVYPAQIPDEITEACRRITLEAHKLLGCRGTSRSDFRWDDSQGVGGLFLLEVNTQPGMTPLSLVPEQARHLGISYPQLCQRIVDEAMGGGCAG